MNMIVDLLAFSNVAVQSSEDQKGVEGKKTGHSLFFI